MIPFFLRLAIMGLAALIVISLISAIAATNYVPPSRSMATVLQSPITANDLKPAFCTMNLTRVVFVTGITIYNDNTGSSLILGDAGNNTISNLTNQADCILAGGGTDTITGGGNIGDVCDGGPGIDTVLNCTTIRNVP